MSCVDKYITWVSHAQKGWLLNIWASAGCCKLCLGWLAIPLLSHFFQLSKLLVYAKNNASLIICRQGTVSKYYHSMDGGGWRMGMFWIALFLWKHVQLNESMNCVSFSNFPHTSILIEFIDKQVFLSTNLKTDSDPGSVFERCHFGLSPSVNKESSLNRQQEVKWGLVRRSLLPRPRRKRYSQSGWRARSGTMCQFSNLSCSYDTCLMRSELRKKGSFELTVQGYPPSWWRRRGAKGMADHIAPTVRKQK